jgi:hypothetical protein
MDEAATLRWLRDAVAARNARESGAFRDVFAAHAEALRRARALEQRNAALSRRVPPCRRCRRGACCVCVQTRERAQQQQS